MSNVIHIPGPSQEGFRIHILLDSDRENVLLIFGEDVNHLPMPPPKAWELGKEILSKARDAEPDSKLQVRKGSISVQAYDRQVLLETSHAVHELTLTPAEARELVFRLCFFAARAVGRDLPADFPLENTL